MSRRVCVLDIIEITEILVHNSSHCRNRDIQYNGRTVCVCVRVLVGGIVHNSFVPLFKFITSWRHAWDKLLVLSSLSLN